ncbi:CHASE2 domain-containing protein [Pusillimonas sp. ANT_WB101]|uniref:CHASE2 domain-containing protein n=1 Tax=Pusillimonas sp. ANT_WB101 TaxID=2597356 RepID=UPI0011EF72F3|nr:CHASE2 domain-containing protein [Pusillimonas sp. ANT_WB101]KAA0891032.1 CHASE2 domain-containing protein [Pusillimonas sp. ANT_WB101]
MAGSEAPTPGDFWGNLDRRVQTEWLLVTVLMVLLTLTLSYFGAQTGIARIDHTFYDRVLANTLKPSHNNDIVIITIDDSSIEALGYWPWRRAVHARLLGQLKQARVVGFDLLLSDTNPAYPLDDSLLAKAIAIQGRVVLPSMVTNDGTALIRARPSLINAAAKQGYFNIYPDEDGVIRSIIPRMELPSGLSAQHLVLSMLDVAGVDSSARVVSRPDQALLIPYAGPPGHYTHYPYAHVLNGDIPPATFRNKYVLVGSWGSGLGDAFPTPLTRHGETMAGVEVLANALNSSLENNWIHTPNRLLAALLSTLPVLLACLAFRRLSPRRAFLAAASTLILTATSCILVMYFAGIWLPITASLIGVAVAYPLWSWRNQEVSLQQLDRELETLTGDRLALGEELVPTDPSSGDETLSSRVSQLHNAIRQLRLAQQKRDDTLRFLSHDMRAPQNSIIALAQLQNNPSTALSQPEAMKRVQLYATKTLNLVDGFVQLARAEAMQFQNTVFNLVDLTEHAVDDFWAQATRRQITVEIEQHPEQAWVRGDWTLLCRALSNLIDNAIKYSPGNTRISCTITPSASGQHWLVKIKDQGRGIAAKEIGLLFHSFQRLGTDSADNPTGAGLGLSFVKTVIERHGGTIEARSQPGDGTEFIVHLPACAPPPPDTEGDE